jgi:hypothetical protein
MTVVFETQILWVVSHILKFVDAPSSPVETRHLLQEMRSPSARNVMSPSEMRISQASYGISRFLEKAWKDRAGSCSNPSNSCRQDFSRLNRIFFSICSTSCSNTFLNWECKILPGFNFDLTQDPGKKNREDSIKVLSGCYHDLAQIFVSGYCQDLLPH